jgi:hypothetical protein
MTRNDNGVWSVTLGPLAPDLCGYSISVDGFHALNPMNREVKPIRSPTTNFLEVSGNPPRIWEFQDVPHGTVRLHDWRSKSLDRLRHLRISFDSDGRIQAIRSEGFNRCDARDSGRTLRDLLPGRLLPESPFCCWQLAAARID